MRGGARAGGRVVRATASCVFYEEAGIHDGRRRQQTELQERAEQTRLNLGAIEKDPKAGDLRAKLKKRLDEFSSDADALGRKIVELESKRLEKKIELEDMIQDLDMRAPMTPGKDGPQPKPGQ